MSSLEAVEPRMRRVWRRSSPVSAPASLADAVEATSKVTTMNSLVASASPVLLLVSVVRCPPTLLVSSASSLLRSFIERRLNVDSAELKGTLPLSALA